MACYNVSLATLNTAYEVSRQRHINSFNNILEWSGKQGGT